MYNSKRAEIIKTMRNWGTGYNNKCHINEKYINAAIKIEWNTFIYHYGVIPGYAVKWEKKQGKHGTLRKADGNKHVHTYVQIFMFICLHLLTFKNNKKRGVT